MLTFLSLPIRCSLSTKALFPPSLFSLSHALPALILTFHAPHFDSHSSFPDSVLFPHSSPRLVFKSLLANLQAIPSLSLSAVPSLTFTTLALSHPPIFSLRGQNIHLNGQSPTVTRAGCYGCGSHSLLAFRHRTPSTLTPLTLPLGFGERRSGWFAKAFHLTSVPRTPVRGTESTPPGARSWLSGPS